MKLLLICLALFLPTTVTAYPATKAEKPKISVCEVIEYVTEKHGKTDPAEVAAIASVESSMTPGVEKNGNYGLMQINCTTWANRLRAVFGYECRKDMLRADRNMDAAVYILNQYRSKYPQCRGDQAINCYHLGQSWKERQASCSTGHGSKCSWYNESQKYLGTVLRLKKSYSRKCRVSKKEGSGVVLTPSTERTKF